MKKKMNRSVWICFAAAFFMTGCTVQKLEVDQALPPKIDSGQETEISKDELQENGTEALETEMAGSGAEQEDREPVDSEQEDGAQEDENCGKSGKSGYQAARERLDLNSGPHNLMDVFESLSGDRRGFRARWKGYYNDSRDRLDMEWEDGTKLVFLLLNDEFSIYDENKSYQYEGWELIQINDSFYGKGFDEDYLNQHDRTGEDEYYPQTSTRILGDEELQEMSQTQLALARNEIYARHGRDFKDPFWNAVFARKSWYRPQYDTDAFAAHGYRLLNSYENRNLDALVREEENRGYRQKEKKDYVRLKEVLSGSWLDMDGDGVTEKIYIFDISYGGPWISEEYELELDNGSWEDRPIRDSGMRIGQELEKMYPAMYAASPDGKTTQVFIRTVADAEELAMDVYKYENKEFKLAGRVSGSSIEIRDGLFIAGLPGEGLKDMPKGIQVFCPTLWDNHR